ncbi:hypothetical protein phiOC_p338 [Ochrobactrum phage vB_OspM_OC]|nr:hypothetical protein phiOC_p338 [Ochrobactrum phage vB_OspM_OC]
MTFAYHTGLDPWGDIISNTDKFVLSPRGLFYQGFEYIPYITIPYAFLNAQNLRIGVKSEHIVQLEWFDADIYVDLSVYKDGIMSYRHIVRNQRAVSFNNRIDINWHGHDKDGTIQVTDMKTFDETSTWILKEANGFFQAIRKIHTETLEG